MEDPRGVLDVSIVWRGKKFGVQMSLAATLKELGDEMQKLTNVKADTMRFIVPHSSDKGSKLLTPFSNEHERLSLQETPIIEGKTIRMMGVSENEVDEILQGETLNLRIAGFDEEEKRLRQRISHRPQFAPKLPQGPYTFCDFRTLQLPGIELNPPPSEALKRMHVLASDPGIVAIMNKHRWRVGIMTEMAPIGYVGTSPKCILGFNKNQGEEISLRLRTDDLKGFRKHEKIKQTLLHELAHMVYSEHDANFYALDGQLNKEANSLDWTRSTSHTLSGVRRSDGYDEEFYAGEDNAVSQKLGGNASDQLESARIASVAAAYRRIAKAPTDSSRDYEVHEEPDPDDSGFQVNENPTQMDHVVNEKLSADGSNEVDYEEPDPDDVSDYQNKLEPDPDEFQDGKTWESEPFQPESRGISEALVTEPTPVETRILDSNTQSEKNISEPNPDELMAKRSGILEYGVIPERGDDQSDPSKGHGKADLHESRDDGGAMQAEPYAHNPVQPEENSRMQIDEPDPDDEELLRIKDPVRAACDRFQKAIELLRASAGPAQAMVVLQTLFKIISNVTEHPNETIFRRLRKANPVIQRTIANYSAAMELMALIGFNEELVSDETGKAETYLVLKRNDPGFMWLAKSCVEMNISPQV